MSFFQRPTLDRTLIPDLWGFHTLQSKMKKHTTRHSRGLAITLNHHYTAKVYTTGSTISGEATITPKKDIRFDLIRIFLSGQAVVRVQDVQGTVLASHDFLEVDMPLDSSVYPADKILRAGQTYCIPFDFVVPDELSAEACTHSTDSASIKDHHFRLPPTMGSWKTDDMAPLMNEIQYQVCASILKSKKPGHVSRSVIRASNPISVLPSSPEDPPLQITKEDKRYRLSKTTKVRHGKLGKVAGELSAVASQAATVYLSPDGRTATPTTVPIMLSYAPSSPGASPPKIKGVSGKLRSQTWWAARPFTEFPDHGCWREPFTTTVATEACLESKDSWTLHSEDESSIGFWSTTLETSLSLPTSTKTILPTFHSCLISRTYSLQVRVDVDNEHIELIVPVQIVVAQTDRKNDADDILPTFAQAVGFM